MPGTGNATSKTNLIITFNDAKFLFDEKAKYKNVVSKFFQKHSESKCH